MTVRVLSDKARPFRHRITREVLASIRGAGSLAVEPGQTIRMLSAIKDAHPTLVRANLAMAKKLERP